MRYVLATILSILTLTGLSACKKEVADSSAQAQSIKVSATLMYRERMLAPNGSSLTVTIQDVSIADKPAEIISEEIIGLSDGIQLPLKIALEANRKDLKSNHTYTLHAKVRDPEGRLMWITTQNHRINTENSSVELGEIMMQRVQSGTVSAETNDRLYPIPYRALGNEPGWIAYISQESIKIDTSYGQKTVTTPRPQPQPYKGGYKYHAQTESHVAIIDIRRKLCYDGMSGRPFPNRVVLTLDGKVFEGCGGDPKSLLTGHEWVVEDLADEGVIDNSRITINFNEEGRVSGSTSCNSYSVAYEMTGENLTFKTPVNTMKACIPALMSQEQKFLTMLSEVNRYDIDGKGALILTTKDGKRIIARH
ncbi:META domain-containing protein [Kangiella sediminilitoris]|uniref:Putative secreted protein containing HslJ-like protein n=1 Tax=Kangiella sediminilitoris TaxID=1144748 RepID=A0A1B3BDJ6_9GAMM|nr:META domain-containing protein [Kangiella sediminilitoris]AOE50886.1 putative secreted protein containing HslJ-like protein [Kangiella sediminilitoris]